MTHMEALSINIGEKVILSYSDLSEHQAMVFDDYTIEVILNGFHYHVSLTDYTDFICHQVTMIKQVGC